MFKPFSAHTLRLLLRVRVAFERHKSVEVANKKSQKNYSWLFVHLGLSLLALAIGTSVFGPIGLGYFLGFASLIGCLDGRERVCVREKEAENRGKERQRQRKETERQTVTARNSQPPNLLLLFLGGWRLVDCIARGSLASAVGYQFLGFAFLFPLLLRRNLPFLGTPLASAVGYQFLGFAFLFFLLFCHLRKNLPLFGSPTTATEKHKKKH